MASQGRPQIRFVLNGRHYELAREDVESGWSTWCPTRSASTRQGWTAVVPSHPGLRGCDWDPSIGILSTTARRQLAALEAFVKAVEDGRLDAVHGV